MPATLQSSTVRVQLFSSGPLALHAAAMLASVAPVKPGVQKTRSLSAVGVGLGRPAQPTVLYLFALTSHHWHCAF